MFQPVPVTGPTMNASPIQAKRRWPLSHAGHRDDCFQMWECLSRMGDGEPAPVDHIRSKASASSSSAAPWQARYCFYPRERLYLGTRKQYSVVQSARTSVLVPGQPVKWREATTSGYWYQLLSIDLRKVSNTQGALLWDLIPTWLLPSQAQH